MRLKQLLGLPPDGTDKSYKDWINENRISRYYNCSPDDNYPWTQLGYTYDWNSNNTSHISLSEFVIKPNSNIKVKSILYNSGILEAICDFKISHNQGK